MFMSDSRKSKTKPTWIIVFEDFFYCARKEKMWPIEFTFVIEDQKVVVDNQICYQICTPEDSILLRIENENEIDFFKHLKEGEMNPNFVNFRLRICC